ncbi:T9SS type A sorting domain-containing protein, partial [Balneola vulgaris]|uniref:T9SS type A sorting domain-containing protein n=1 Tax=Balneola vulgaris TaxID=287535 RepID=UPI0012F89E59
MKNSILLASICFLLASISVNAQSSGDIAFTGFNSDGEDDFSFVVLKTLPSTTIYFTDNEWSGSTLGSTEGTLAWVTGGSITAGTVVTVTDASDGAGSLAVSAGSITESGTFDLDNAGDVIYAYIGSAGTPSTFLAAIANKTSNLNLSGTGLVEGVHAIDISNGSGDPDAGEYTGIISGTISFLLTTINDIVGWVTNDDGEGLLPFPNSNHTISGDPSQVIYGNAGWRMLSMPITGGIVTDVSDDAPVQGIAGGDDPSADANFYYNPGADTDAIIGWTEPDNVTTAWGDGLGFIMYFYDNTTNGSSELPLAIDASGSEPSSTVTVDLTHKYTLIGNPFQAVIKQDDVEGNLLGGIFQGGLVSPIAVWNDSAGTYLTYNFGEGNTIDTWQGFVVERNSIVFPLASEVNIPTSAKVSDTTADISSFNKMVNNYRSISLALRGEGYSDLSNKIYFSNVANEGYDSFDGSKIQPLNGAPYLAFTLNHEGEDQFLVQDARSMNPQGLQVYHLDVNDQGQSGEFTISWEKWKNIPSEWSFTITDNVTGEEVDMRSLDSYTFNLSAKQKLAAPSALAPPQMKAKGSGSQPRFTITMDPGTSVSNEREDTPDSFVLQQNYPNPFNPSTTIRYSVAEAGPVQLTVYNVMGQKVAQLINETKTAGSYQVT